LLTGELLERRMDDCLRIRRLSVHRLVGLCILTFAFLNNVHGQSESVENKLTRSLNEAVVKLRNAYNERQTDRITDLFDERVVEELGGRQSFSDLVVLGQSAAR